MPDIIAISETKLHSKFCFYLEGYNFIQQNSSTKAGGVGMFIKKSNQKSNLHYTRRIMPKRVTSCGAHLRGLAPGQNSSEETSQRWRVVGDSVPI